MTEITARPDRASLIAYLISERLLEERTPGWNQVDDPKLGSDWQARVHSEFEALSDEELAGRVETSQKKARSDREAREREEENSLPFNRPSAIADLVFWGKMARWTLEEAIALSLGRNPSIVTHGEVEGGGERFLAGAMFRSPFRREYLRRHSLAARARQAYELSDPIKPEDFLSWALRVYESIPPLLVETVQAMGRNVVDARNLASLVAELQSKLDRRGSWPWGTYETKFLRELEAAATRFWINYDPNDATTAPKNETVVQWLEGRGNSKRIAEAMATILRADGMPTGPRVVR